MVLALHVLGYITGSCLVGVTLGFSAILVRKSDFMASHLSALQVILGGIGLLFGATELGLLPLRVPQFRRQVPSAWRSLPSWQMALLYGGSLGCGLGTRITVSTFHFVVLWAILFSNLFTAVSVFAGFGIGRALPLLWVGQEMKRTDATGHQVIGHVARFWPLVRPCNGLALSLAGAMLLGAAMVS